MNLLESILCLVVLAVCVLAVREIIHGVSVRHQVNLHLSNRQRRRLRLNAKAPEHGLIFAPGTAINAEAEALPEVIQLAPFGRWPTRDKSAVQVFNAESAEQVISWFNFWPRRLARLARLNAIKIWVGHPDFAPQEWPERIELGSITDLFADEHGLNARVQWNAEALEHVRKHKFPSVAWDCEVNGDGTETPAMLWSVGMWHKPNIKSVQPVINAVEIKIEMEPDQPEPAPEPLPANEPNQQPENTTMLKKIIAALIEAGIIKESDSEDSVMSALASMIQSIIWKREETARRQQEATLVRTALNAAGLDVQDVQDDGLNAVLLERYNAAITEAGQMRERITQLETRFNAERSERINAVLAEAISAGRITKAEEEGHRTQLNASFDEAMTALSAIRPRLNAQPVKIGMHKPAIMDARQRAERINAWVTKYMETNSVDYATAWNASTQDPDIKPLHEAAKQADEARSAPAAD
jgi:phage I-like protein